MIAEGFGWPPRRSPPEMSADWPGPHATLAGPTFEEWLDATS